MRKFLLSSAAVAAITIAAESAAIAAPPPIYSWTGCYIGGNVGGGWAHKDFSPELNGVNVGFGRQNASHVVGGLQGGCDYQYGMWVFGVQGLYDWTGMNGAGPFVGGKGYTTHISWFSNVSGRAGYLVQPNGLLFFRGGEAWVRDHHVFFDPVPFPTEFATVTRTGLLLGGGYEWMFAPNFSVTFEYDNMDFGNKGVMFTSTFGGGGTEHIKQNVQVFLVNFNFRFGGPR
jgi:outer membrane immunogenic protein